MSRTTLRMEAGSLPGLWIDRVVAQAMRNVGKNVKGFRDAAGLRQEDVARTARQLGFGWSRSTVAMFEAGNYELKAAELLALPEILRLAGVGDLSLPALLASDTDVELTGRLSIPVAEAVKLVGRGARASKVAYQHTGEPVVSPADTSDADEKMARNLGVDIWTFLNEAFALWGSNLADERDRIVAEKAPPGASNRTLQALRAHATRALKAEIEPRLKED